MGNQRPTVVAGGGLNEIGVVAVALGMPLRSDNANPLATVEAENNGKSLKDFSVEEKKRKRRHRYTLIPTAPGRPTDPVDLSLRRATRSFDWSNYTNLLNIIRTSKTKK
jgi:hypothetical protein